MLRAKIDRFRRGLDQSRGVESVRRHPGLAAWCFVFFAVGLQIQVWTGPPPGPEFTLTERDECTELMAKEAVAQSLDVIGHGVEVSSVEVRPIHRLAAARYTRGQESVAFALGLGFRADEVLHIAAHESVHAIFDQAKLNPDWSSPGWESRLLVEVMAASVIGAHIAGRIRTRQGGDGEALTARLIEWYRKRCTWGPGGLRRVVWSIAKQGRVDKLDREVVHSIVTHYGSPEMVDAIDRICRENPDPWDAAHVVAERYLPKSEARHRFP